GIATNRRTRVKMRRHGRGHVAARRETHDADVVLGQMISIGVVTYPTHRAPSVVDGLRIAMTRAVPVLQHEGGHVMPIEPLRDQGTLPIHREVCIAATRADHD